MVMVNGDPGAAADPGPGTPAPEEDPGLAVLADLLLAAMEADRVSETVELLADLVGERPVRAAHEVTMQRLADAVEAAATPPAPDKPVQADPPADVFALTRRVRAETSARGRA